MATGVFGRWRDHHFQSMTTTSAGPWRPGQQVVDGRNERRWVSRGSAGPHTFLQRSGDGPIEIAYAQNPPSPAFERGTKFSDVLRLSVAGLTKPQVAAGLIIGGPLLGRACARPVKPVSAGRCLPSRLKNAELRHDLAQ